MDESRISYMVDRISEDYDLYFLNESDLRAAVYGANVDPDLYETSRVERPLFFEQYNGRDQYPFEVLEKKSDSCFILREMHHDQAHYTEALQNAWSNHNGKVIRIRKNKKGIWKAVGDTFHWFHPTLRAYAYVDPTF